jgi:tetratricopeptide (TPR) repeat protein
MTYTIWCASSHSAQWLASSTKEKRVATQMYRFARVTILAVMVCARIAPAQAADPGDCLYELSDRRIEACTALIEKPGVGDEIKGLAYMMRALGLSLQGDHAGALMDYDHAIASHPNSAVALNNRAWTHYKLNQPERGLPDVERSLILAPASPHALDTRAHINQALGRVSAAKRDYTRAMNVGGERIIRLYQCGLGAQGLYSGGVDGSYSQELGEALKVCVNRPRCDPLPADEECRSATS